MNIAVLGGGNGSYAAAADFTLAGHEVRFWRRDFASFRSLTEKAPLRLLDHNGRHDLHLAGVVADIGDAVRGADLILFPAPAFAQADVAEQLAPYLQDGQVIFLPPGSFGSYIMADICRQHGCTADVAFAETGTLPWLTRRRPDEDGLQTVAITTRASRLPSGVHPARHTDRALAVISAAFPGAIEPVEDALSAALMNAGPIIHPPLIIMNAGPIAHFDKWDIHNEGTQPSIRAVHDALDGERIALRTALGYAAPHFPLSDHYNTSDWMYGNLAHDKLVDSGDWHEKLDLKDHRYMSEDIAYGLCLLVTLGEWMGFEMPVSAGLLSLGGVAAGTDFRKTGRSWSSTGLAGLDIATLKTRLETGAAA